MPGSFWSEARAQEGESFQFLVQAIIGIAIVGIIFGVGAYMDDLRVQASTKAFEDGFESALDSPTGDVVRIGAIVLPEGAISDRSLSEQFAIAEGCVSFVAPPRSEAFVSSGRVLQVNRRIETTVYVRCVLGSRLDAFGGVGGDCRKSCEVSVGVMPEAPEP